MSISILFFFCFNSNGRQAGQRRLFSGYVLGTVCLCSLFFASSVFGLTLFVCSQTKFSNYNSPAGVFSAIFRTTNFSVYLNFCPRKRDKLVKHKGIRSLSALGAVLPHFIAPILTHKVMLVSSNLSYRYRSQPFASESNLPNVIVILCVRSAATAEVSLSFH